LVLMSSAATVFLPLRATALPVPSAATSAMKAMTKAGDGSVFSLLSMCDFLPGDAQGGCSVGFRPPSQRTGFTVTAIRGAGQRPLTASRLVRPFFIPRKMEIRRTQRQARHRRTVHERPRRGSLHRRWVWVYRFGIAIRDSSTGRVSDRAASRAARCSVPDPRGESRGSRVGESSAMWAGPRAVPRGPAAAGSRAVPFSSPSRFRASSESSPSQ
jgi:hypothetical protein